MNRTVKNFNRKWGGYEEDTPIAVEWEDDLADLEKEIRTEAIKDFAEWLQENVFISNEYVCVKNKMYTRIITFIELLDMYEKEQKC